MSAPPSVLYARDEPLGPWMLAALLGHVGAVAGMVVLQLLSFLWWVPNEPLFDPDDVIEVAMVALPKSQALPTRATRQAAPKAPESEQVQPPEPPPPRQSDLAVHQDVPDPKAPAVPDNSTRKLDELREQLRMEKLLDDLEDADVGAVDRDASSPDGVEGAKPTSVVGASTGDPETARYIAQLSELFMSHFRPLPMLKGQGLIVTVLVKVDQQGRITEHRVEKSSGNPSWDRAAIAAIEEVGTVPRPPEKYRDQPLAYRTTFQDE